MKLRGFFILFLLLMFGFTYVSAAEKTTSRDNNYKVLQKKLSKIKRSLDPDKYKKSRAKMPESKVVSGPSTESFVKMGGGMVFTLVLIVFSLRWLKQFQKSKLLGKGKSSEGGMDVLETCFLGKEQRVVLLNVRGKELLIGVTGNNINLLGEYDPVVPKPSQPSKIHFKKDIPLAPPPKNEMQKFTENLNTYLAQYKKPKTVSQKLSEM